jgi:transposase
VDDACNPTFRKVSLSIQIHYIDILNFFNTRSTNAVAESFNAKVKTFRVQFRGVKDKNFFLYSLSKLYG